MIDGRDGELAGIDRELKALGADHRYIPLLHSVPGIAWVLGYTIAAEIGDIHRFASPKRLTGYTGLCPRVYQSGGTDRRGPLTHAGPKYLRWGADGSRHARLPPPALPRPLPAQQTAPGQAARREGRPNRHRPPAGRGDLAHAHTRNQPFAPAGATPALAA